MEFLVEPRLSGACGLLEVPAHGSLDADSDEGEVVIGIRPKSSPLPRRRGSETEEDSEPDPALCGSRRVSFADARGLSLVQVKEFDLWDVPGHESSQGEGKEAEEYFLSPLNFSLPLPTEELFLKVWDQKVELETMELLPETTTLKGVIRVLNISFGKAVYVRTSLDAWSSHFDLLAEHVPGSSDGLMDRFSFKLVLVPPFGERGARVDFCVRYETPDGAFWANNNNRNYVLLCHQRTKDKPQRESVQKKSCLKTVSRNLSCVENISAAESTPQENNPAVVSKHEEEEKVNTVKAKQISNGQSGTSGEGEQKAKTESKRFSSQRSARKAARMARVQDLFAQRSKDGSDSERDESPPGAEREPEEEPTEGLSDVPSISEGRSKSQLSPMVWESLETRCKSFPDVSPANHRALNGEPEQSESSDLADFNASAGGESATDTPDNPGHSEEDEPAPAERPPINTSVRRAEEESRSQRASCEATSDGAAEPGQGVISAESCESLLGPTHSFTFGTVVAPLYRQMFGRGGSESQSAGDGGNPVLATPTNTADLSPRCHHAQENESCRCFPTDVASNGTQESDQECSVATPTGPPTEEEESSFSVTAEDLIGTRQDPGEMIQSDNLEVPITQSGETQAHLHTRCLHPGREAQEVNLPPDLQNQTPAEAQLNNLKTLRDKTTLQTEPEDVSDEAEQRTNGGEENGCRRVKESITGSDNGENVSESTTNASPGAGGRLEHLQDVIFNQKHHWAAEEAAKIHVISGEVVDGKRFSTPLTSQETQKETEHFTEIEVNHQAADTDLIHHDDALVELEDENTLKDEPMTADLKQQDFGFTEAADDKTWEMMVEEEEEDNVVAGQQETGSSKSDMGGQLEERGGQKAEKEVAEGLQDAGENGTEAGDAEELEERAGEVLAETGKEAFEKEYVQTTKTDNSTEEEAQVEVERREERDEAESDQGDYVAAMQEVGIRRINVPEEVEIEFYWNNGEGVGAVRETQINPREENTDGKNSKYGEEIVLDGAMASEAREEEVELCVDESSDTTQNQSECCSCAPVDGVRGQGVNDGDKEGGNAHSTTEMDLHQEEDHQSGEHVTHGRPKAEEPENEPTSPGSASAESDSDDEVELYMHCLRAVHAGTQVTKDRHKDARAPAHRRKPLSMPSISESLDEEPHLGGLQGADAADARLPAAAASPSNGEKDTRSVSWWRETFSCSNIAKTLLYTTLIVAFLGVAYHYDFLACFGLYLISVAWLWCQRETQPVKKNNQIG